MASPSRFSSASSDGSYRSSYGPCWFIAWTAWKASGSLEERRVTALSSSLARASSASRTASTSLVDRSDKLRVVFCVVVTVHATSPREQMTKTNKSMNQISTEILLQDGQRAFCAGSG